VLIDSLSGREIPVIVTTGDSFAQPDLSKTVTVLQKPYSVRDLIKVMTWLMRQRKEIGVFADVNLNARGGRSFTPFLKCWPFPSSRARWPHSLPVDVVSITTFAQVTRS
jgi:hypothetical protein